MPGFGTTSKTMENAVKLSELMHTPCEVIDICETCMQIFRDQHYCPFGLGHNVSAEDFKHNLKSIAKGAKDLIFENVQARVRTTELFSKGFVIGTGDMSELANSWCTYNGDHMSNYNVNCGVPKTLVKFLVEWIAKNKYTGKITKVLMDIVNTTISPELLPAGKDGEISQSTEDMIGPYELLDFFLFHMLRNGYSPDKILFLAKNAKFSMEYSQEAIEKWLNSFYKRFFAGQFKRDCVPNGPKVGCIDLSPRGSLRLPSDADPSVWLNR
jgi:NAD+ synthase (glutamine-hydrolysing)